jgi:uncharacterized protein (DUF1778 family)
MDSETTNRTARIEARVNPETQTLLKRAAELQGRSLSDFVISAARDAALETIADMETVRLSRAAQAVFVDSLLNPPEPAAALRRAVERNEALIEPQ